jgi:uncharacterized delta-60 repeat protein
MDRIIVAGTTTTAFGSDFAVARLTVSGALDPSFDGDGKQTIDFGSSSDSASSVTIDSMGRIVVAGTISGADFGVARLTDSGALDTSVDADGKQTIDFGTFNNFCADVAVDSTDRVIVAGYTYTGSTFEMAVARLTSTGALDASFDADGIRTFDFGFTDAAAMSVAIDSMDRVILAGYTDTASTYDFAVVRLTTSGAFDSSFDADGRQLVDFGSEDFAYDIAIDPTDRIVVSGGIYDGADFDFGITRLTSNGDIDIGFAGDGTQTIEFGGEEDALAVALDPQGRAVLAGFTSAAGSAFAVARLTGDNVAPTADPGGPYVIAEGQSLALDASNSFDPDLSDTLTYSWDVNGDGIFGDAAGVNPTLSWAQLNGLGIVSGPHLNDVRVRVDDGQVEVESAATTLTVNAVAPSSVQGLVYVDFNNDGEVNFGELGIAGVNVTLTGINDLGQPVNQTVQTDPDGIYVFSGVRPSDAAGYTLTESQPAGFPDGIDTLGAVNTMVTGSGSINDAFSGIVIASGGSVAENYNFGERPPNSGNVTAGQTAGIGFWQNKHGQNLIKALNGGASATQLGHWLAVTFPNMYGALDGMTNAQVAANYKALFSRNGHTSPGGPPKTDAQIMATALAVYVTNQTLAGTTASAYGFQVTTNGVGARTFNVGNNGAALGVANNSTLSVMDLLLAVNAQAHNGLLYDLNGDGQISGSEASLRTMANDLFSAINESGGI